MSPDLPRSQVGSGGDAGSKSDLEGVHWPTALLSRPWLSRRLSGVSSSFYKPSCWAASRRLCFPGSRGGLGARSFLKLLGRLHGEPG